MNFFEFKNKYQKRKVSEYPHQVHPSPVVSVLVQTYQHKKFIHECLNGILNQKTHFPFEILLGEDSSTDGTREICVEYAEKYPDKIRLFLHHPQNKINVLGITTGNFNALYNFFSSKGEFVAFCEGDDRWNDPLKLQKQIDQLRDNTDYALSYHSFIEVNNKNEQLIQQEVMEQPIGNINSKDLKRLRFHPLLSTICFRNHIKGLIPEEMIQIINVDSFLLSLMGSYGGATYSDSIKSSFYRRHEGGIWSKKAKLKKYRSKILTYKKLRDFNIKEGDTDVADYFTRRIRKIQKMMIFNIFKFETKK